MRGRRALALLLLLGCRKAGRSSTAEPDRLHEVRAAWGPLVRCVLGAPLAPDENATDRVRRINLGWAVEPRTTGAADWPRSCESSVEALVNAIDAQKPAPGDLRDLLNVLQNVRAGSTPGMWVAGKPTVIERMMTAAKGVGLEHPTAPSALDAPAAVAPAFQMEQLLRLGDALGYWVRPERYPRGQVRVLVMDDQKAYGCELALASGSAACEPSATRLGSLAHPLSGGGGEWIVWDFFQKKTRVIFDTKPVDAPLEEDAFVLADGSVVGWDRDQRAAIRVTRDGKIVSTPLALPAKTRVLDAAAGLLFLLDEGGAGDATLSLLELGPAPLPKPIEVGKVPRGLRQLTVCRNGTDLAAIVGIDGNPGRALGVFGAGGVFTITAPIDVAMERGSTLDYDSEPRHGCGRGRIDMTWLRKDKLVARLECTKERCLTESSKPLPEPHGFSRIAVASLGGNVMVVRTTTTPSPLETTFSLQMLFAPMAKLHEGRWRIVLGNERVGGPKAVYRGVDLVVHDDRAALLSFTGDGLFAMHVDDKGQLGAMRAKH